MERILIIGCSCSGKSTLAKAMHEKLGLPLVHLDQLWWQDGWTQVSIGEFDSRLDRALEMEKWIIDGNFSRTMPLRLSKCDTIIYLDFNRWDCLLGMCRRVLGSYGKTRPDMSPNCPEHFDLDFVKWIWNYNKHNRSMNYSWIGRAKHARAIILKNRAEVKTFLESL